MWHSSVSRVAADFIMGDGRKASCVAHHGMVDGECGSTAAGLWCVLELPVISGNKKSGLKTRLDKSYT